MWAHSFKVKLGEGVGLVGEGVGSECVASISSPTGGVVLLPLCLFFFLCLMSCGFSVLCSLAAFLEERRSMHRWCDHLALRIAALVLHPARSTRCEYS